MKLVESFCAEIKVKFSTHISSRYIITALLASQRALSSTDLVALNRSDSTQWFTGVTIGLLAADSY